MRCPISEAKNASICRLFRHLDASRKGCPLVLYSDNNFVRVLPGVRHRLGTSTTGFWRDSESLPLIERGRGTP
jgi:hypothetical protein